MRYVQTDQCNTALGAPPGATIEECGALPVFRGQYANGQPVVMSWWKPDAAELEALKRGEPIRLELWGSSMPPAYVGVGPIVLQEGG